jgi:clathrin heavy chain
MESEKYICVRDQVGEERNVVIIDLQNPSNVVRRPIAADSALMNPVHNILALKDTQNLQIFNIGERAKVNDCVMSEPVEFWKWISDSKLALVTASSVYHWSMNDNAKPQKIFARHQSLAGTQIINYRVDAAEKWCAVIGITRKDDRIAGAMQLYSVDRKVSQALEGHAAAFSDFRSEGSTRNSTLFCFASRTAASSKLYILEVGQTGEQSGFEKKQTDIYFPAEAAQDFPVAMQVSDKYSVVYMITKFGYIHIFDVNTGKLLYMNRISAETIFVTAPQASTGGIIGVNRKGQVLSVTIDENTVVPYICTQLNDYDLAIKFATKNNLRGAEELVTAQFNQLFQQGRYKEAAKVCADSPQGMLRSTQTIQMFSRLPGAPGQPSPLLQYFSVLLEKGKLNKVESLELSRPVLQQGRKELLQNWLKEEKLDCSEELGDLVRPYDPNLALSIYYLADSKDKVVQCLADSGQYERILLYSEKTGYSPDFMYILNGLVQTNPQGAANFAAKLLTGPQASKIDVNQVVDLFLHRNMVQETTSLLLDVLKGNKPEEGPLQTRLLEVNLMQAPQVADAIMGYEMLTHYNKPYIAQLCEKAGLYQRALEHYTNIADIKRVMLNTHAINPEFLVNYFGQLSVEDSLDCLKELMKVNPRQNAQTVVAVATKYSEQLTPAALIDLFETFNSFDGLYLYLGAIVSYSQDPEVHFKYIEAAVKMNAHRDVERICRESNYYDPKKVRDFLKEARLPDQLPLIIVCDRFDFVEELTRYLYANSMLQYIEAYVQKINPINTPAVVGALLDVDCGEEYIQKLIMSVRNLCPVDDLVAAIEKRNRLKLLLPWLEARVAEGNQEPATHNALAKIYIDLNREPEKFLNTNTFYDSRVVGKYCENRDPHLAFLIYKRGLCDDELVAVTNKNSLFKSQARYLVERQSQDLWLKVLDDNNEFRQPVLDQVVQTALPESKNPDEVSSAVKALMNADMPKELIGLLEKIVLEPTDFSNNKNLQNLLILTAIKADSSRVMVYVNRLDNFDGPDIATIAEGAQLYDEAVAIYKKFKLHPQAITVLLNSLNDLEAAVSFASQVNEPEVYSLLAKAQLQNNLVTEAIESYIKANDPENYVDVIVASEREQLWDPLVKFLQMCRKKVKEAHIESELIYALAKVNRLAELEEFISGPNCAQIQLIGDRCFEEGMYEAAKLLFSNIHNHARLATTLVKLQQYSSAVEAARKAGSTKTWKEVNLHLIEVKEFRLAQICALHIVIHGDELDELVWRYESRGYFEEIISVLTSSLGLDRAHKAMFTELAILYSKYKPEKLQEHLELFPDRISLPKVIRWCQTNGQWKELTYLYKASNEHENAAMTMITHPVEAWEHNEFKSIITKVNNLDTTYKAVRFYLSEHPLLANDLLHVVSSKVDHTKVVSVAREMNLLALVKPYLTAVQSENVAAVNEALNELYIEEEDYDALKHSIETYDKLNHLALARTLEKHELLEFRRIAAQLYKQNSEWQKSVELSKSDDLFKDAMQTAAESGNADVVEELLRFFVGKGDAECFAACLYTCYDYVKPDVVLELAWKHSLTDYAMPYLIQAIREYTTKVDDLVEAAKPKKDDKKPEEQVNFPGVVVGGDFFPPAGMVPMMTGTGQVTMVPTSFTGMPGTVPTMHPSMTGLPPGSGSFPFARPGGMGQGLPHHPHPLSHIHTPPAPFSQ